MGIIQWYAKYQIHATYAGYVHTLGYTKYAISKYAPDPKYVLSAKGKKWLRFTTKRRKT
jgi:hypothetical protein